MGFLNELVSEFTHSNKPQQQQQQYSGGNNQGSSQPPPVSPPWYAEWDGRDNRWLFVNQQTGERTFNYPGPGFAQQQGSYGPPGGGYGGGHSNQGAYGQRSHNPEQKQGGNGWKYAAAGAAGLAGGALLMHEGEEVKQDWDRLENRVDYDASRIGNDVENFPENAANWTGEQVGRTEAFGDRVENRFDNAVDDVEDFPENAARWTGDKVQEVEDIPQDMENRWDNAVGGIERYGDRIDDAYDQGRDDRRYEDDSRDDW